GDADVTLADYLITIDGKTGALIEACCRAGARIGGAADEQVEALASYGRHVGRAFQVVDDLLDYRGDHRKTGKPWATDLREGCATWP
ncbi:polyprenyl synthetase family protein, partial [Acinetobacter baumannii]